MATHADRAAGRADQLAAEHTMEEEDAIDDDTGQGDVRQCQVKGCTANLQLESLKHQRLRICSVHEKARTVKVNGIPSRFCQQCTKFHGLDKFDGLNKGCRKRLQKHNERRKQKTVVKKLGKELQKVVGSLLCAKGQLNEHHNQDAGEFSGSGSCAPLKEASALQTLIQSHVRGLKSPELVALAHASAAPSPDMEQGCGSNLHVEAVPGWRMEDRKYTSGWQHGSHRKLRSTPMATLTNPPHGSSATNCPWGNTTGRAEEVSSMSEQAGGRRASPLSAWGASNEGSNEMDDAQPATHKAHQPPPADRYSAPGGYCSGGSEESHCYNDLATNCSDPVQTSPVVNKGLGATAGSTPATNYNYDLNQVSPDEVMSMAWNNGWHPWELFGSGYDGNTQQPGGMQANTGPQWHLQNRGYEGPGMGSGNHFTSSMKIAGITPGALPDNLREEILSWLQVEPQEINGSIRPGCVHLTLDMWFQNVAQCADAQDHMPAGFAKSVASQGSHPWCSQRTVLRMPNRLITANEGKIISDVSGSTSGCPSLAPLSNVASPGSEITLLTTKLEDGTELLCRYRGQYVTLEVVKQNPLADGQVVIAARLPEDICPGLAWLELCSSASKELVVGDSIPILVTDIPSILKELQSTSVGGQTHTAVLPKALLKHVAQVLCEPMSSADRQAWLNSYTTVSVTSALCGWDALYHTSLIQSLPLTMSEDAAISLLQRVEREDREQALFEAQTALFVAALKHGTGELPIAIVTLLAGQQSATCPKCMEPSMAGPPQSLAFHGSSNSFVRGGPAGMQPLSDGDCPDMESPEAATALRGSPSQPLSLRSWFNGHVVRATMAIGAAMLVQNAYGLAALLALLAIGMGITRCNILQNASFTLYWAPASQGPALPQLSSMIPAVLTNQTRSASSTSLRALPKEVSNWTAFILTFGLVAPLDLAYCKTAAVYMAHIPVDVLWAFATILLWQSGARAWQLTSFILGNALGMLKLYLSTVALHPMTFADVQLMHPSGISILIPAIIFHIGRGVLQSACIQVAPLRTMLVLRAAMWLLTLTHSWLTDGYFLREPSNPGVLHILLCFLSTFVADLSTMSLVLFLRERLISGSQDVKTQVQQASSA